MNQSPPDSVDVAKSEAPQQPSQSGSGSLWVWVTTIAIVVMIGARAFRALQSLPQPAPSQPVMTQQQIEEFERAVQAGETGPAFRTLLGVESEQKSPPNSVRPDAN